MKKLFLLAYANIRKSKANTTSLFLMFLITALLLNVGLLVFFNFGGYFEKIFKELDTSSAYYLIPNRVYQERVEEYLSDNDNVMQMENEDALWLMANAKLKEDNLEMSYLIMDADQKRDISKWKLIGEHLPLEDMSIYLPYIYQLNYGYELNDTFDLYIKEVELSFQIKGFMEDAYFSSRETGAMGIYLNHDSFLEMKELLYEEFGAKLIFANLTGNNKDVEYGVKERLNKESEASLLTEGSNKMQSIDRSLLIMARTIMANLVSIMIVAFSGIIAVVCIVVVRFRISNWIEEDMTKIGALKAMGYTSRQLIAALSLQFVMIAFTAGVLGIILSYITLPAISEVLARQSGLKWVQGFDAFISCLVLGLILLFVTIIAYLASARIKRLQPIAALRGGIVTHSFRKNYLPLHKSKGSLIFLLAMKSILQNKKQSLMIIMILIAVSFSGAFSVMMFYNSAIDSRAFNEIPGVELSNALAILAPGNDNTELLDEIEKMEEVRKLQFIDTVNVNLDRYEVYTYIMEDYSEKETNTVYEGRYPKHENEVALAGYLADVLNKRIGDSITLTYGNNRADYIITGLTNGANMGGMHASLQYDGILRICPEFRQQSLQIYLKEGVNAGEFTKELKIQYADRLLSTIDMDKEFENGTSVYISIISKLGIVILIVSVLVVILVLYSVIHSSIVRRKQELGIQKAIGFTTLQLMNQLALGLLPPIAIGVMIGSYIGMKQSNAIMSVAQRAMGIMKASYTITPGLVALFGAAILVISYLTSILVALQIRRISAYRLVAE